MNRKDRVSRILMSWMGVTALILSVACSQGGGGDGAHGNRDNSIHPPTVDKDASTSGRPAVQHSPRAGTELDTDSSRSQTEDADVSIDAPGTKSRSSRDAEVMVLDPSGQTPEQIFGGRATPLKTDRDQAKNEGVVIDQVSSRPRSSDRGTLDGNLHYSGSGHDSLYEELKTLSKASDRKFASKIGFTTFAVDSKGRKAQLTINILGTKNREYTLTGVLGKGGIFRAGSLEKAPHLLADAVCMDQNGGCDTVHIRLREKSGRVTRTANVIVRHTRAWLYSEGDTEFTGNNTAYDRFVRVLTTSARYPGGASSLTDFTLTTSETVNGPSEFAVSMLFNTSIMDPTVAQAITWMGPLVKPVNGDDLNLVIEQYADYNPYGRASKKSSPIASFIRDSRLIRNDGHGNLQIDVTFARVKANSVEQTARLTVARIHSPTREIVMH